MDDAQARMVANEIAENCNLVAKFMNTLKVGPVEKAIILAALLGTLAGTFLSDENWREIQNVMRDAFNFQRTKDHPKQ